MKSIVSSSSPYFLLGKEKQSVLRKKIWWNDFEFEENMLYVRDDLSSSDFAKVKSFMRLRILLIVVLHIDEELSRTSFLEQSYQWRL